VSRIATGGAESYEVRVTQNGREETITAQAVVLATPAYTASRLVAPLAAPLAQMLSGVAYAAVAVVAAGYYARQASGPIDGFGVLIPRAEKYRTLGTVWNSSLFPGRAREGKLAMTSFTGGATDPDMIEKPEKDIAAIVEQEIARMLEISGPPIVSAVWKHPKALPQYNLGHGHVVQAIRDGERALPGLFFAGNYLQGPAIGKCVEQALQTADAVNAFLQGPKPS
jgi:oxygen-dependent protoporphyrinogen oxidase